MEGEVVALGLQLVARQAGPGRRAAAVGSRCPLLAVALPVFDRAYLPRAPCGRRAARESPLSSTCPLGREYDRRVPCWTFVEVRIAHLVARTGPAAARLTAARPDLRRVRRGELHTAIRQNCLHRFRVLSGLPLEDHGVMLLQVTWGRAGVPCCCQQRLGLMCLRRSTRRRACPGLPGCFTGRRGGPRLQHGYGAAVSVRVSAVLPHQSSECACLHRHPLPHCPSLSLLPGAAARRHFSRTCLA